MLSRADIERIWGALASLGAARLTVLGIILGATVLVVLGGSLLLSSAEMEAAYIGLAPQEASRIGRVLAEANIPFDVSSDGTRLMTRRGDAARARALLAERGLPSSPGSGYELFDKVGPLGLTSFMQDVTRTRALEGEIVRTLQLLKGVRSARVHLALGEQASLRRQRQSPSASVLIRTDVASDRTQTAAIQHIVAAALPGLGAANVRVISADGQVLSSPGDDGLASSDRLLSLERSVALDIQNNINRTLAPQVGVGNFETSVSVRLNIDKRQTNETSYNPDTRVERSTRVIKESTSSQNGSNRAAVSVEQNVPADQANPPASDQPRKAQDKRDELTNYEVGGRQTSVTSDGYRIERLSVAVVLNSKLLPNKNVRDNETSSKYADIERLVASAAGLDVKRGDQVTVAVADFAASGRALEEVADTGNGVSLLAQHSGLLVKVFGLIAVAGLLIFFGLRPVTRALLAQGTVVAVESVSAQAAIAQAASAAKGDNAARLLSEGKGSVDETPSPNEPPAEIIRRLVNEDPARAALVIKRWIREETAT